MKRVMALSLTLSSSAFAAELPPVKIGGFIDTYYAYDFNRPADRERQYTTQPVKHNEFNINLAHIDITLQQEKTRGRLALQYGNSVDRNYSSEANPDAKIFQEAYVGKKIGENTWIDAGIFLGNIGAESWISKENYTYTRSLNLDYVPYYSSGLRIEHTLNNKNSFQLQILNGWQNISENNDAKAIGMQYKHHASPRTTFTYNNFFGDEKVVSNSSRFRAYHNFILHHQSSEKWQFIGAFDIGHQSQQQNDGVDAWYATTMTARYVLDILNSLSYRAEYYNDRHQANVVTGTPGGFQIISSSINYDHKLATNALWRTELRGFHSKDKIYPTHTPKKASMDGFIVTSLSMWF